MVKNQLVIKSNNLVEAFCIMNQNECKVIAFLISKIDRRRDDFDIQTISVKEFNELLGIKGSKSHSYLKTFEKDLLKKMIEVKFENGNRLNINWFSHTEYKHKESTLEIGFNLRLKEHLLELSKNYTKYSLRIISGFNSYYSIRIYELLKQYEKIGHREIELEALRLMLGIKPNQYIRYNDFKRNVILYPKKELEKCADIYFDFEEIKKGKKITKLKFKINANILYQDEFNEKIEDTQNQERLEDKNIKDYKEITGLIDDFNSRYNGTLDYNLIKNLVNFKGLDCVKTCVSEFVNFVDTANKVENTFYDFTKKYGTPEAYTKGTVYKNMKDNKPIQATNYNQREYDDEFFNSLYKNFDLVKDELE